jgi:hypothetical protein
MRKEKKTPLPETGGAGRIRTFHCPSLSEGSTSMEETPVVLGTEERDILQEI